MTRGGPPSSNRFRFLALALLALSHAATAATPALSVQDELKIAHNAGIEIIYSTDLVPPQLRAPPARADATPLQRAAEALAPSGLALRAIGAGRFVVVRAEQPAAATPSPSPQVLDEISVYASRYSIAAGERYDGKLLTQRDIQSIPGSHDDPLRSLRALPGLATSVSARPYIRGSLADDVLVRYDGVTLLDPYHLKNFQSLYSAIDPLAVGGMEVYSGGYPVRYGTRSGGVIDIAPRPAASGNEIDLALSQTSVGAAISGKSDSLPLEWLATIRNNSTDLLLEPIESMHGDPRVTDATGRLHWTVNDRSDLNLGWLLLDDSIGFGDGASDEAAHARYRDQYVWLGYACRLASNWQSRTTLALAAATRSRNGSVQRPGITDGLVTESRSYNKLELSSDWTWEPEPATTATLGAAVASTDAEYNYTRELALDPAIANAFGRPASSNLSGSGSPEARSFSAYGSMRHGWPRFEAELGVRLDGQDYIGQVTRMQWSPRLNLRYDLDAHWHAYGSVGRFTQAQAIEDWRAEELQQRADPTEIALHTVLGLSHDSDAGLHWSLEFYRKRWSSVSPYYESQLDPSELLPDLFPDRVRIAPDASEAHGVELSVQARLAGGLRSWLGITAADVHDEFAANEQVRSWNQPFAANGGISWSDGRVDLSAALGWHTGWPRTPIALAGPGQSDPVVLGERNSAHWNNFLSFDLRGSWTHPSPLGDVALFAEITNSTDRHNLCCTILNSPVTGSSALRIDRKSWLPAVLNLGVTLRWRSPD